MRVLAISTVALSLVGCATLPATQSTPFLPAGVYGVYEDNDIGALNFADWAFASAYNTRGNPIAAAKAIISLEYLAGELSDNPRWVSMDGTVKIRMKQARDEVRRIVGIWPDAPPQLVVNVMLQFTADLLAGNQAAATQVLSAPIFSQPPQATMQVLYNLPYVQSANLATSRAQAQSFPPGGPRS